MNDSSYFTGRQRKRTTGKGVAVADVISRLTITVGGIGTIVAVLGVCVFLLWVVVPLFESAEVSPPSALDAEWSGQAPIHAAIDKFQGMGWLLLPGGRIRIIRIDTGELIGERRLFEDREITCSSFLVGRPEAVFGFADGSIELLSIGFETSFPPESAILEEARAELGRRAIGDAVPFEDGVVQLTPEGQNRLQRLSFESLRAEKVARTPIRLVDHVASSTGLLICVLSGAADAPRLTALSGSAKEDFLTGGQTIVFEDLQRLPVEALERDFARFLSVSGSGRDIYLAWETGRLLRIHRENARDAFISERGSLVADGVVLTAMEFILGDSTLLWGDSTGCVRGGFLVRIEELEGEGLLDATRDGERSLLAFAFAKELEKGGPAVVSIAPSGRSRLALCGFDDGAVRVYSVTSEGRLGALEVPGGEEVSLLAVAPREDGFIAVTPAAAYHCALDTKHPEADMASLFLPVWYEEYARPQHMWQSSSASDDFEPKLGLAPLIFGSIKATLYAMLFGAPLALLAAVYSSEFLNPRVKAKVKPTIELMASLPSVVLGFLGALVFAPFVEKFVPGTLALFVVVPFCLLLSAHIWQIVPAGFTRRVANWRPLFLVVPVLAGIALVFPLNSVFEGLLFSGDIKGWLAWDGQDTAGAGDAPFASATGGWFLLMLPLSIFIAVFVSNRVFLPYLRRLSMTMERSALASLDLARFLVTGLVTVAVALAIALLLNKLGLDVRGDLLVLGTDISPFDTYVQRNALIVGFVMGFAIIPIIYTIADDALSSVPEHLRSGSLGSGATPWQTATRIVIPTAMSGLFSALMIGLGRAVGETMIVLMALGNTAIMDWNVFNGARTLSANIAVELPEAVRDSAHYRTLFLAALVLFAMTFVINTVAEIVRLRFRKRAYQL